LIALAVVVLQVSQPAAALPILQFPYFSAGPVWALNPSMQADFVFLQTNASHLFADNNAALAISFAPQSIGPSPGLAFAPIIAQTSSRVLACDRSFFVIDEIG